MKKTASKAVFSGKRGSMDTKNHGKAAYLIFLCTITGITVLLRSVASFLHLSEHGYYEGKLAGAADLAVLFGALLLLTFALTHWKDVPPRAAFNGPLTFVPAAPLAATLLFAGASLMLRKTEGSLARIALPLLGIFAVIGALYFFFAVFFEKKQSDLRAVFGAILSLYLILYAGYLYFDTTLPINAATKICDQIAFIAAALFFLLETRVSLGRVHWAIYTAGGLCASLLTAYSAIPSLLVYIFEGRLMATSLEDLLVTVMLTAYIFCRTLLFLIAKPQAPTALMAELQEKARLREEEVRASGPLPFEPQPTEEPPIPDGEEESTSENEEEAPAEEDAAAAEAPTDETYTEAEETEKEK